MYGMVLDGAFGPARPIRPRTALVRMKVSEHAVYWNSRFRMASKAPGCAACAMEMGRSKIIPGLSFVGRVIPELCEERPYS